jgi:hypothetical protein
MAMTPGRADVKPGVFTAIKPVGRWKVRKTRAELTGILRSASGLWPSLYEDNEYGLPPNWQGMRAESHLG